MYEYLDFILKRWRKDILSVSREYYEKLKALSEHKCTVAVLGLQSSGKSTLLNGIIGYPVLPVTEIKGTTCPLFLEYGEKPLLTAVTKSESEVQINGIFSEDIFSKLIEYVCTCVNEHIFFPENMSYFMSEESTSDSLHPSEIFMNRENPKHGITLAMIVFSSYIENDGGKDKISQFRENLMRLLGIKGRLDHLILKWPSEAVNNNTRLIDLPGLGSVFAGKDQEYSLDKRSEQQSAKSDVILFITTPETVGGQLQQVCERIYSGKNEYGSPVSAIVINRADEVQHKLITLNAAQAMLPLISVNTYMISAISGEYKFLGESVPIERTIYWRWTFLPDFKRYSDGEDITEADRKIAVDELRESYTLEYEYGCKKPDGEISPLSFEGFISTELKALCEQRVSQMLHTVYSSDKHGRQKIDTLAARDTAFMVNKNKYISGVWGAMAAKTKDIIRELDSELTGMAGFLSAAISKYAVQCGKLRADVDNMLMNINISFAENTIRAAKALESTWGFSRCTSIEGNNNQCRNDQVINRIYGACSVPEMLKPAEFVEEYAEEISCRAEKVLSEAVERVRGAFARFAERMNSLPDECLKEAEILGMDRDNFRRYFYVNLYYVSENVIENVMRSCCVETGFAGHEEAHVDFDLDSKIHRRIKSALNTAVLFRMKRGDIILRKNKLIRELAKILLSSEDAEQLLTASKFPARSDNLANALAALRKGCLDANKELQYFAGTLQSVIKPLYQECEQTIKQDKLLLKQWLSQINA